MEAKCDAGKFKPAARRNWVNFATQKCAILVSILKNFVIAKDGNPPR